MWEMPLKMVWSGSYLNLICLSSPKVSVQNLVQTVTPWTWKLFADGQTEAHAQIVFPIDPEHAYKYFFASPSISSLRDTTTKIQFTLAGRVNRVKKSFRGICHETSEKTHVIQIYERNRNTDIDPNKNNLFLQCKI